jgi:fatty acid amide hydrolase 2
MWLVVCAVAWALWLVLAVRAYLRYRRELDGLVAARATFPKTLTSPVLALSATEMARQIKSCALTSVQCCTLAIERIRACNPSLNALVCDRFAEALKEARQADEAADKSAPFHGVPTTIKEAFAVRGMPNSSGLIARRHVRAHEDADAVARLRKAGFIVLGVSNTSELCMWCESSNPVYGRTASSGDARVTSGGSSGGEAALVGAHCVPAGLGSDIGGSIRMPAYFNGVFGLKPTAGLVSNAGQYPCAVSPAGSMFLCTGPIAQHAEDLHPLLQVLAARNNLPNPRDVNVKSLRVFSLETIGIWGLAPPREAVEAQRRAANSFSKHETIQPFRHMSASVEIWSTLLQAAETETFSDKLYQKSGGVGLWRSCNELAKWSVGWSDHTLPAIGLALLENFTRLVVSEKRLAELNRAADELRAEVEALLGDDGVLLFPSFASLPPYHSRALLLPVMWIYTALWNTLHLPVVQVPLGCARDGRPLGCQVIAKRNCDHLAIAAAMHLERTL